MIKASFLDQLKQGRKFAAVGALLGSISSCTRVSQADKEIGAPVAPGKVRKLSNYWVMTA